MTSQTQQVVRQALKERGPSTADELVSYLAATGRGLATKNPKTTVRNATQNDELCISAGSNRYVYLPAQIGGAAMRLPIPERTGLWKAGGVEIPVGSEVTTFLWPTFDGYQRDEGPRPARIALEHGPVISLERPRLYRLHFVVHHYLTLPVPFWRWWEQQQARGADTLVVRCIDGETGAFCAEAVQSKSIDPQAVQERNEALRQAAANALSRGLRTWPDALPKRVIARGVYHTDPAPDPLAQVLFDPPGSFVLERGTVAYRRDMTPAFWRVFGHRQKLELARAATSPDRLSLDALLRSVDVSPAVLPSGGAPAAAGQWEEEVPAYESPRLEARPQRGYRLKVSLQRMPDVWRVIEILDIQDFKSLHLAIQRAFGWDNDHLYSFFISGRSWDQLTEIAVDFDGEREPPSVDEVALGDLELQPGHRFLYLFDYGDNLRHDVEVLSVFPAPKPSDERKFPRIVERHGKAPPQYPSWDG
jgi:hypothetical protein